jgi:predicted transcriptional regulator
MNTRVVTAHLPTDLAERLDDLAERLDRPKGWIVKEAIASYVAREQKRHRLTMEALADVDAGRMLEHAEVEAWAAALPSEFTRAPDSCTTRRHFSNSLRR